MAASSHFVILPSSHADAGRIFPGSGKLEGELRATVRGEVRFDAGSRALYATDASNYRQIPIGLVTPVDDADVVAAVAACRRAGAPVLPRGAGTSLAGQACNEAVVLDFSKFLRRIWPVDATARRVRVQPGAVLDRVREAAEEFNLTFAPDPATHNRCTLGGMIGNNSCGTHGLMGGKTVDNIESMEILLYDGTRMLVGRTPEAELEGIIAAGGRRGEIYAGLRDIRDRYAELIRTRFPRIARRVSGYNLDELLPESGFHVARALAGSEGTCVTVLEATLQLVSSPQHRITVGAGFPDVFLAADAVPWILQHGPIGLEGMDDFLVNGMAAMGRALLDIPLLPEGRGFLLVEFGGETVEEVEERVGKFAREVVALPGARARVYDADEAERVWRIRESALGTTAFVPGRRNGWEGWEDAAVAPEKLGAYLRAIYKLLGEFGYSAPMYGHFGQGCVHMRIDFDLESEAGVLRFREFVDRAADVALTHGGSLSGEHGDGQARAALLPKMFGPELMEAFQAFKRLWDPENKMNPGKLIGLEGGVNEPHANLRLGADYAPWEPKLHFAFRSDGGSMARAALRCVGVGACRKTESATMCPSYMVTREEKHSTRGRAHLLWELMQGEVLRDGWRNEEVREALDLCLSCKACKSECPVGVDVPTYKSEFLAHHWAGRVRPLEHYAFGRIDRWARLASRAPGLVNRLGGSSWLGGLGKSVLGIHEQRRLPEFSRAFTRGLGPRAGKAAAGQDVFLWADTFNNYMQPGRLESAYAVLGEAGFRVEVAKRHLCCGRPLYDFGMLTTARQYLLRVLDALGPQIAAGTPVVVLEPSCASVFKDEMVNLLPDDPRAARLREQVSLLGEFLVGFAPGFRPPARRGKILVHGHCHQRALGTMADEIRLLQQTGAEVELLDSGCCGMAGPFGFEREKFAVSQALGERVLLPAVRGAEQGTLVVSDGFSCREQIAQNTAVRAVHLADVLAGL